MSNHGRSQGGKLVLKLKLSQYEHFNFTSYNSVVLHTKLWYDSLSVNLIEGGLFKSISTIMSWLGLHYSIVSCDHMIIGSCFGTLLNVQRFV